MTKRVVTLAMAAVVVLGFSGRASAQLTATMPTFELSAGYQLVRAGEICGEFEGTEECTSGDTLPFGLAVDAVRNYGALGIVAEGGWSFDSRDITILGDETINQKTNLFHLAGGARWTGRNNPRIWPYGQVLAGVLWNRFSEEDFSDTSARFMIQPGVGVNFVAGDGWGVVTQVDYRRVFLDEDEDFASGRNDVRVFLGLRMILD
jgi:hypothetical protein